MELAKRPSGSHHLPEAAAVWGRQRPRLPQAVASQTCRDHELGQVPAMDAAGAARSPDGRCSSCDRVKGLGTAGGGAARVSSPEQGCSRCSRAAGTTVPERHGRRPTALGEAERAVPEPSLLPAAVAQGRPVP